MEDILQLPAFGAQPFEGFAQPYAIVTYFSDLDCQNCIHRELKNLRVFSNARRHELDFLLIVHDPIIAMGGKTSPYLSKMRRVAMVRYPILLEPSRASCGLGHHFTIFLVDTATAEIQVTYQPDPNLSDWPFFEKRVAQIAGLKD